MNKKLSVWFVAITILISSVIFAPKIEAQEDCSGVYRQKDGAGTMLVVKDKISLQDRQYDFSVLYSYGNETSNLTYNAGRASSYKSADGNEFVGGDQWTADFVLDDSSPNKTINVIEKTKKSAVFGSFIYSSGFDQTSKTFEGDFAGTGLRITCHVVKGEKYAGVITKLDDPDDPDDSTTSREFTAVQWSDSDKRHLRAFYSIPNSGGHDANFELISNKNGTFSIFNLNGNNTVLKKNAKNPFSPIEVSRKRLPPHFEGYRVEDIFPFYDSFKNKGEFETTVAFKKRIFDGLKKSGASWKATSSMAFWLPFSAMYSSPWYNADNQTLNFRVKRSLNLTHNIDYEYSKGFLGLYLPEITSENSPGFNFYSKVSPAFAKKVKSQCDLLAIADVSSLKVENITQGFWTHHNELAITCTVKQIWLYNKTTGEVYFKITPR